MDCIICYKIFLKDFEFANKPATNSTITIQRPDLTSNVGKLLSVTPQLLVNALGNDYLCYDCINNFSNIDDLYKEIDSINAKLSNYKDQVEKQIVYAKILSDTQISNGQMRSMSESSSARLRLLEELQRQEQQQDATLESHDENSSSTGSTAPNPENDIKIEVDEYMSIDRDPLENTENSTSSLKDQLRLQLEAIRLPNGISTCDVKAEPIARFIERDQRKSQENEITLIDITLSDDEEISEVQKIYSDLFGNKSLPSTSNNTTAVVGTESEVKKSHRRRRKKGLLFSDRVYKCGVCKKKYGSTSALDRHLKKRHPSSSTNTKTKSSEIKPNPMVMVTCTSCNKVCTESEIKSHQVKGDNEESVDCNKCESSFSSNKCLKYHQDQKHGDKKRNGYECQHCKRNFGKEFQLKIHLKDYDERVSKNCEYCPVIFHGSRCIYYHCMTEHREVFLQCRYCQKSLSSEFKRLCHEKIHIREGNVPGQPPIRSPRKAAKNMDTSSRNRNLESSPEKVVNSKNPKVYRCKDCHKGFKCMSEYKRHIRMTRSVPKKCKINNCNKKFYRRSCIRYHNSIEHQTSHVQSQNSKRERRDYNFCVICEIKCDSSEEFKEHNKTIHSITDSNNCPICQKHFTHSHSVRSHLLIHLKINPYKCSIEGCTMSFHRKDKLTNHERTHSLSKTKVNPTSIRTRVTLIGNIFTCTYCPLQFPLQEQLRQHTASEHEEYQIYPCRKAGCMKKFKLAIVRNVHEKNHQVIRREIRVCNYCDKTFRSKNTLAAHVNVIHTKERTFHCHHVNCGKKFMTSNCLLKHSKRHDLNQTKHKFPCNFCEKKAKSSAELMNHLKNYHSISNEVANYPQQLKNDQIGDEGNEVEINNPQNVKNTYQIIKNPTDETLTCGVCSLVFLQLVDIMSHMEEHKIVDQ